MLFGHVFLRAQCAYTIVSFCLKKTSYISPLLRTLLTSNTLGPQYMRCYCRKTVDFLSIIQIAKV